MELIVTAYPKSGVTWLIRLLSDTLDLLQCNVDEEQGYWGEHGRNGIIRKRHTPYSPEYKNKLVIAGQRDPRDVIVSAAHYRGGQPIGDAIKTLLTPMNTTLGPQSEYTYVEYVSSWFGKATALTRYELLHERPVQELQRICQLVSGTTPSEAKIKLALKRQSFANMQAKLGEHFCRKGVVGDWRNHFTKEDGRRLTEGIGEFMLEQGYIDSLNWWEELEDES